MIKRLLEKQGIKKGALMLAMCLAMGLTFTACGDDSEDTTTTTSSSKSSSESSSKSSSKSSSESSSSEEESSSSAEKAGKKKESESVVGTWKLAAIESQGVTMAGDFSEIMDLGEDVNLVVNEDGTGNMTIENETVTFSWSDSGDAGIELNADGAISEETGNATTLSLKDGAVFMKFVTEDSQEAYLIYTKDGNYDKAKLITMDGATDITSADELIGKWNLIGMNMMGISAYGDAENLKEISGGEDMYMEFREDGTVDMSGTTGSWTVGEGGATLTSSDISGEHTVAIKKTEDGIIMDYSESMGGMQFIVLLEKE